MRRPLASRRWANRLRNANGLTFNLASVRMSLILTGNVVEPSTSSLDAEMNLSHQPSTTSRARINVPMSVLGLLHFQSNGACEAAVEASPYIIGFRSLSGPVSKYSATSIYGYHR